MNVELPGERSIPGLFNCNPNTTMGIRKRILLIALISASVAAGLLYLLTSCFILRDYKELESEEIQRSLHQAVESLDKEIEYLDNTTADWAYWTDTYKYIQTRNAEYIDSNLSTSTLEYLDLDILVLADSRSQPVFQMAINPTTRSEIPLTDDLAKMIQKGSVLPPPNTTIPRSGIVMTSQGPLVISARNILRSDQSGPAMGTLLFGRYLNESSLFEFSGTEQLGLKLFPVNAAGLPTDFQAALAELKNPANTSTVKILAPGRNPASKRVAAYTLLNDLNGQSALILRVDDSRTTFLQGRRTVTLFGGLLALCCLIIGIAIYYSLDHFLNHRLLAIHHDVNHIRQLRDFSQRVAVEGNDEVSDLALEINHMLGDLSQYQAELLKSDSQFREMLHNLQLVSVILDIHGTITFCNDFFLRLTGWTRVEVMGKNWFDLFPPHELRETYQSLFETILAEETSSSHLETCIVTRNGDKRLIAWNNSQLSGSDGSVIGIARIGEDITERRDAEEKLHASLEETRLHLSRLTALRQIDREIASDGHVQEKMQAILTTVQESLKVDAVGILLAEDSHSVVTLAATQGSFLEKYQFESLNGLDELLLRLHNLPQPLVFTDLSHASRPRWLHERLNGNTNYNLYVVAPLVSSGNLIGALEIFSSQKNKPDPEWLAHLQSLALQTAIALDSAEMIQRIESAKNELAIAYEATLIGWAKALELRDKDTKGHSERMMELAELLGKRMGMDETALRDLKRGTLLHDIGKMGVPDHILHKPGPLTDEEWIVMRQHPQFAYDLLHSIPYLASALEVPYCHHERWDGKGYPRGLSGENIPLSARIFTVMDVWDALIHTRPYRPAWTHEKAIEYIRTQAGIQFDPRVVEHFLAIVEEQPVFCSTD